MKMSPAALMPVVVACLLFSAHSPVAAKEPVLKGKWKVISTTWYGKDVPDDNGVIWEFQDDDHLVIRFKNGRSLAGQYKFDAEEKPWHFEIETTEDQPDLGGGGPQSGIVSIEGDRLQLCVAGAADVPRPKEMVSKEGTLNILRLMKRVKDTK